MTRSALQWEHGRAIAERAAALGIEVRTLPTDRLNLDLATDERRAYVEAKQTLAVVVAPPSKRRLQPIAPSADWRLDLAEGCPAHCSYCYLAGSLSKFAAVEPLLPLAHGGRTRMRASIAPARFARFEGGKSPVASRLAALARMGEAGYPIGLTIAPIMAAEGWEAAYAELLDAASLALARVPTADLSIELITHRFSPGSKAVLQRWYPGSDLEMGVEGRSEKRTRFGSVKQVHDAATMKLLRRFFEVEIARVLPNARILYWT